MGVLIRSDFMGTNYISFDGEIKENIFIFPIPPLIWSYWLYVTKKKYMIYGVLMDWLNDFLLSIISAKIFV